MQVFGIGMFSQQKKEKHETLSSVNWDIPSGKRLHNYGKIHHF